MPALRLTNAVVSIRKFDVVGKDSEDVSDFVRHVGLSSEENLQLSRDSELPVVHMAPPLRRGERHNVQTIGTAELTMEEILQINTFIDELQSEYEASKRRGMLQYILMPHVREADAEISCRLFNCAGFVIEAYRDAGIDLLETNPEHLPHVPLATLIDSYPDQARRLSEPDVRACFGLVDSDAYKDGWPVVLAGYVMNSLRRNRNEILGAPYRATPGDELFPSTRH